jgi:hypothetical protein
MSSLNVILPKIRVFPAKYLCGGLLQDVFNQTQKQPLMICITNLIK